MPDFFLHKFTHVINFYIFILYKYTAYRLNVIAVILYNTVRCCEREELAVCILFVFYFL